METSIIKGNPQTLPQIRIDDVEAASCLNVTAIICHNNLLLIIINGKFDVSIYKFTNKMSLLSVEIWE
jgi:hypothetical protein